MPYTERSRANLLAEGIASASIYVTGNPIKEVMDRHADAIERSDALDRLGVDESGYLLLTAHRQETVDLEDRLSSLVEGVTGIARELGLPLVCSVHPRTRAKLESFGVQARGRRASSSARRSASSTSSASSDTRAACSPTAARCRRSAASSACRR